MVRKTLLVDINYYAGALVISRPTWSGSVSVSKLSKTQLTSPLGTSIIDLTLILTKMIVIATNLYHIDQYGVQEV